MKPNESIAEMFIDIINGLEGLGKRVSEQDKVSKILRCLPPKWNSKTEAIEEEIFFKELPLKELIGSLMTYEMKIGRQKKKCKRNKAKEKSCTKNSRRESC